MFNTLTSINIHIVIHQEPFHIRIYIFLYRFTLLEKKLIRKE